MEVITTVDTSGPPTWRAAMASNPIRSPMMNRPGARPFLAAMHSTRDRELCPGWDTGAFRRTVCCSRNSKLGPCAWQGFPEFDEISPGRSYRDKLVEIRSRIQLPQAFCLDVPKVAKVLKLSD